MPTIYLRKDLYDSIIRQHKDPSTFVNKAVEAALKESKGKVEKEVKDG